eukprot:TRINITY_DN4610_c0_g1_i1.p1 TRINITY_DN4610_c0_g1~~TRINITY_DN4610_c0_g1_i1.p1  ORF type:complete len:1745 (+),score=408.37 TRINITY_DN4610_c0_g1_i1:493-5235(+)
MAAVDDVRRHKADAKMNSQRAKRIRIDADGRIHFELVDWAAVSVGDVLMLVSEEEVPADLVPLASSGEDGLCYVSTASLDGETNLKIKAAAPATQMALCGGAAVAEAGGAPLLNVAVDALAQISGVVSAEAPNPSIHTFSGSLQLASASGRESETKPLNSSNLLLRGTQLRNTAWCFGVVVYTGVETRLVQNSRKVPIKIANLESVVNRAMAVVLGVQAALSLLGDALCNWTRPFFAKVWYLHTEENAADILLPDSIGYFFTFFILYSNLMPISLYATMEIGNYFQAYFIKNDLEMYDEEQDCPAAVRSTNLCHELGQVSFIFSDKTGTLTQNVMELKRVSIAGQAFGTVDECRGFNGAAQLQRARQRDVRHAAAIDAFLEVLAVSHTVVMTTDARGKQKMEAESPDEGALVEAAGSLGWEFIERSGSTLRVRQSEGQRELTYTVEALNAFTSARKRMSAVVLGPDGERHLLVKGADNVMLERARSFDPRLPGHLEAFALDGLRTLVLGRRCLGAAEYAEWKAFYDAASNAVENREALLQEAAERIERDLDIVGATAIEDKLQVGVAETIESIRAAGIRLWVLTGDKLETARIIGYSCKVLSREMDVMVLDVPRSDAGCVSAMLETTLAELFERAREAQRPGQESQAALLVTGQALEEISNSGLNAELLEVAVLCAVVIACRVSPSQKAEMVRLVRDGVTPRPVTLSVGDGANDVPMIQEAQVGVGISGKEGRQAVNAADFSVAQFRFLRRLLCVHGRWNYRRSCKLVLYTFWKNAVLTLLLFYYTNLSGYSGTSLFEDMVWNSFNAILTFPIVATGIFDRDVDAEQAIDIPELYVTGRLGTDLNQMKMVETMLSALVHSLIILLVMLFAFHGLDVAQVGDYYTFGTSVYSWLIISMNYRVAFITTTWNWMSVCAWFSTFIFYIVFIVAYSMQSTVDPFMYGVWQNMTSAPLFWIGALAVPALAIMVDIFKAYLVLEFFPDRSHLILEAAQAGKLRAPKRNRNYIRVLIENVVTGTASLLRGARGGSGTFGGDTGASGSLSGSSSSLGGRHAERAAGTGAASFVDRSSFCFDYPVDEAIEADATASPLPLDLDRSRKRLMRLQTEPRAIDTSLVEAVQWERPTRVPTRTRLGLAAPQQPPRADSSTSPLSARWCASVSSSSGSGSGSDGEAGDAGGYLEAARRSDNFEEKAASSPADALVSRSNFAQQSLPSVQLVLSGANVRVLALVVGTLLAILATVAWMPAALLPQLRIQYDGVEEDPPFGARANEVVYRPCPTPGDGKGASCDLTVKLSAAMSAPIRVLYVVEPFWQNHNAYLKSFLWDELTGKAGPSGVVSGKADLLRETRRRERCSAKSSRLTPAGDEIYPCGLAATSVFNDTFEFLGLQDKVDRAGVAWQSDLQRYGNPAGYPDGKQWNRTSWLYERYPTSISEELGARSEHFITWMRPGALPRIAKSWGFLNVDLAAGETLTIRVGAKFPIGPAPGVSKTILLTPYSTLGGRNDALGLLLSVSAAFCYLIAVVVTLIKRQCPRKRGSRRPCRLFGSRGGSWDDDLDSSIEGSDFDDDSDVSSSSFASDAHYE